MSLLVLQHTTNRKRSNFPCVSAIGNARGSTIDQSLKLQKDALRELNASGSLVSTYHGWLYPRLFTALLEEDEVGTRLCPWWRKRKEQLRKQRHAAS